MEPPNPPPRPTGRSSRRQITGVRAIEAALSSRSPLRLLLVRRNASDPAVLALVARAQEIGIAVRRASANDLERMSAASGETDLLGLLGPDPTASLEELLAGTGAAWLLAGIAYPGNAGFAIRTAEVSGADGIILDSPLLGRSRHRAVRASMHATRFFPVHWEPAERTIEMAQRAGKRIVGIENSGVRAPWETDLTGSVLLVLGGEEHGIPAPILERCDEVVQIPMAGFIPSYNLHAAMAAVAAERLRQIGSA